MRKEYTFKYVLSEICRLLIYSICFFVVGVVCFIIYVVTYERGYKGKVTLRKVKRIRALSRLKLWFYRTFPKIAKITSLDGYLSNLEKRIGRKGNGM